MPSVSDILQMRQTRQRKDSNSPTGKFGLGCAFFFTFILAILFLTVPIAYAGAIQGLPSLATLPLLLEPPNGLLLHPTQILDRTGKHVLQTVQNPAIEERRYLPISETASSENEVISHYLVDATVTIVDPSFWQNPGFSIDGLLSNQSMTLAQRLVADLLLSNEEPGLEKAIRERILAWQLTNQFGRERVMEWYLNSRYYGNLAYGTDAAAQVYFGKSAADLSLAEAALLTSVGEAPTLNPIDAPEEALKRQKIVLEAMVYQGYITPEESLEAAAAQLEFREPIVNDANSAQVYLNLVWEQLAPFYDLEQIERGGYTIITSLDYDLQSQATCTRDVLLERLTGSNNGNTIKSEDCPAARLLPTLAIDTQELPKNLGATLVVLEPSTGQILALVGDTSKGLDPTHLPGHPPGSMLTPFLFLTAFTRGFSPASLLWDVPFQSSDISIPPSESYHGPVRLRTAMANNYLNPAVQTMIQIGADNVWQTTQKMGLTSFARFAGETTPATCRGCELLFDEGEVTLLEITHAYSTFANQGLMIGQPFGVADKNSLPSLQPVTVLNITDRQGKEWLAEPNIERRPVITQQLAYLITNILSDEVARWASLGHPNPLEIGRPAAAKVGGTINQTDTWTIGYTPQTVVGIWAGNTGPDSSQDGKVPVTVSATLWHAITQYISQDLPATSWEIPPGISNVDVCDPSGQLPTRNCPTVVSEVFINGNEPTQFDSLYQAFQINRETGLLATVFTPPELIEERVFVLVPPMASDWAKSAGIPTPPESYDVISTPTIKETAQIKEPQMFMNVRGEIEIWGTASGDGFISYRLQAGQGLNPQVWIQISEDVTTPIENGLLATWDTSDLNGLYAIQMIVLRDNRRVDTNTIQITVDNLNPEISIPYPEDDQQFTYKLNQFITLQAEASDNIGLKAVVFYLDDQELIRQIQPPFAVPWRASRGEHTLRVEAIDLAGNRSEASVVFSVTDE